MTSSVSAWVKKQCIELGKNKMTILCCLVVYLLVAQVFVMSRRLVRSRDDNEDSGGPPPAALEIRVETHAGAHTRMVEIEAASTCSTAAGESVYDSAASPSKSILIAIGSVITSKTFQNGDDDDDVSGWIDSCPFFDALLPSFCETASLEGAYEYRFYLAYDRDDPLFGSVTHRATFVDKFYALIYDSLCQFSTYEVTLKFVECDYSDKPNWAQNDAMVDAYLDGAQFFYRVNDDTLFKSERWTEEYIEALNSFSPPLVGVVGPRQAGGSKCIRSIEFVHRTHVEMFGFYYPRLFTDLYADTWMTNVYLPDRSRKLDSVKLEHSSTSANISDSLRARATNSKLKLKMSHARNMRVKGDKLTLQWFLNNVANRVDKPADNDTHYRILSMSLSSNKPEQMWSVIRLALQRQMLLPGWTLRVYLTSSPSSLAVADERVLASLRRLGVELAFVPPAHVTRLAPAHWALLAVDDPDADAVVMLGTDDARILSDGDLVVVDDWMERRAESDNDAAQSDTMTTASSPRNDDGAGRSDAAAAAAPVFVVCEEDSHTGNPLVDRNTLWGVQPDRLRALLDNWTPATILLQVEHSRVTQQPLPASLARLLRGVTSEAPASLDDDINDVIWRAMSPHALHYESPACGALVQPDMKSVVELDLLLEAKGVPIDDTLDVS